MANLERLIEQVTENLFEHVYELEDITNDRQRNNTLKAIARVCKRFDLDIREFIPEEFEDEYRNGYQQGGEYLIEAGLSPSNLLGQNVHSEAVQSIAEDTVMDLQAAIRFAEQNAIAYVEMALQNAQNVMAEGILMGANRKQITKSVMQQFAFSGLTSFITSDGKRLPLDFYAKTVVRTKLKVAHTTGAVNRYKENGVKYGQTNEHHPTCGSCASRQGVIFRYTEEGDSSVPLASEVGLPPYHPNCRHTVRPIVSLEGRTIKPFNPNRDPRTPFQKKAYDKEQDIRRKANAEKKAYNRMRQVMPERAPATLGAYRRMKRRNDEKWHALQEEFRSISESIKSGGNINPSVFFAKNALTKMPKPKPKPIPPSAPKAKAKAKAKAKSVKDSFLSTDPTKSDSIAIEQFMNELGNEKKFAYDKRMNLVKSMMKKAGIDTKSIRFIEDGSNSGAYGSVSYYGNAKTYKPVKFYLNSMKNKNEYRYKTLFHEYFHARANGNPLYWEKEKPFHTEIEETATELAALYMTKKAGIKTDLIPAYPKYLLYNLPKLKQMDEFKDCKNLSDFGMRFMKYRFGEEKTWSWEKFKNKMDGTKVAKKMGDNKYINEYIEKHKYTDWLQKNADKVADILVHRNGELPKSFIQKRVGAIVRQYEGNGILNNDMMELLLIAMDKKGVK
jgi:SPP1 gp7 family putative phage head morphogenesis protein